MLAGRNKIYRLTVIGLSVKPRFSTIVRCVMRMWWTGRDKCSTIAIGRWKIKNSFSSLPLLPLYPPTSTYFLLSLSLFYFILSNRRVFRDYYDRCNFTICILPYVFARAIFLFRSPPWPSHLHINELLPMNWGYSCPLIGW